MGQKLARRHDWPERLVECIEAHRYREFKWGENDCALFACNVVQAMTDIDIAAAFRGNYDTDIGAAKALIKYGAGDLASTATMFCGPECVPALAQRGDMVLIPNNWGGQLGICLGTQAAMCSLDGLVLVSMGLVEKAWPIGR